MTTDVCAFNSPFEGDTDIDTSRRRSVRLRAKGMYRDRPTPLGWSISPDLECEVRDATNESSFRINNSKDDLLIEERHATCTRGSGASSGRTGRPGRKRGARSMGRYPFLTWMKKYLENCGLGEVTLVERERRLRRIYRDLEELKSKGIIATTNPEKMTEKEVGAFVNLIKKRGVKKKNLSHEIGALSSLLKFVGNFAVQAYRAKNPNQLRNLSRSPRLPPLSDVEYRRILDGAKKVSDNDWTMMESYAIVILSIGSGARHKEIKEGLITDLHLDEGLEHYHVAHPKGEDTYGEERDPPIRPECISFLRRYKTQRLKMRSRRPDLEFLFPALKDYGDGKLSTNSITKMVRAVGKDAGVVGLDLHKCRRTYGQLLLDEGADIETVSVLYGHMETSTTERSYCRRKQQKAQQITREIWAHEEVILQRPGAKNPLIDGKDENTGYA